MKKLLFTFLLILICSNSYSQTELVNVSNPVYDFLKRMQLILVIPEYNSSAAPLSRKKISSYLLNIKNKENLLNSTDKKILSDLSVEFEYDMYGSVRSQNSLLKKNGFENIFNDRKEKYLYFYSDSGNTFFSNFNLAFSQRGSSGDSPGKNSITLGRFGLDLRGTLFNTVAYSLNLNRGAILYGDSADIAFASKTDNDLKGNYSFSKDMKNFNSFEGYLRYQTGSEWMSLMFGRSKFISGYGYIDKLFLSENSYPLPSKIRS